ncbi:hypothetical protein LCGC14_0422590 [marine sediment metagenome]|uniref:Uncharacterized protein n=1 Tax=marine sediment metagenome TaxID=412755 RepID=A0A0F9VCB7_9ZZZZ
MQVEIVAGTEGKALYINDYRVTGPKPWAGGTVIASFDVPQEELKCALERSLMKNCEAHTRVESPGLCSVCLVEERDKLQKAMRK